jgi:hypothetical protein
LNFGKLEKEGPVIVASGSDTALMLEETEHTLDMVWTCNGIVPVTLV